ncbi:hypothetical protein Peur_047481 [Populus x canadensis]
MIHSQAPCATKLKKKAWCTFRCGGLVRVAPGLVGLLGFIQVLTNCSCVLFPHEPLPSTLWLPPLLKCTCPFSSSSSTHYPPHSFFCTIYSLSVFSHLAHSHSSFCILVHEDEFFSSLDSNLDDNWKQIHLLLELTHKR